MAGQVDFSAAMVERIGKILADPAAEPRPRLKAALRTLGKWRSTLIAGQLVAALGATVQAGPFRGMKLPPRAAEGCFAPKLLGTYESVLHPLMERIVATGYRRIVDIGCAEGYYAVGLARRMADTEVLAFDTNEAARATCAEVAAKNGVGDRVRVGGTFRGEDFAAHAGALVICDIEGAEQALLDPAAFAGLAEVDLLVEAHDCFVPGLSAALSARFAATHTVEQFRSGVTDMPLPPTAMDGWDELDRLLATWEWRSGPTPWLFMTRRD